MCNVFNSNELQKSLKIRVFATNFAVGCLHASYERHFVKKIQHLLFLHTTYYQFNKHCLIGVFSLYAYSSVTRKKGRCPIWLLLSL